MRAWPSPAFLILALSSANARAEPPAAAAAPSASPAPATSPVPAAAMDKPDDGAPTLAYVSLGLGGAALLTGGVFGIMALDDQADLKRDCPEDTCPSDWQTDVDAYESKKLVAGIGLISGGAFAALGAVLFLTSNGDSEESARLGLWWGGEQGGVYGAF